MSKQKNKQIKIFLVEDDRSLSKLYQIKLKTSGYLVETAQNGQECLDRINKIQPDLILLDVILPKIDGFTVLKKIKQNPKLKKIPIFLLTNLGQDEDIKKGKSLGVEGYLIKAQFTPAEIVKKIEQVLNK